MTQLAILFISIILLLIAMVLLVPIAILFIECSAALFPGRNPVSTGKTRPNAAILVPAHNEADAIAKTLTSLLPQLQPEDRLIVIADNCSDNTAAIANQYGVVVLERRDNEHRGKGYAVDYALNYLEANSPPEVVVNVDADCVVHPGTIDKIVRLAATTKRPVQSTYLMVQPYNPSPKDMISALAVKFKNLIRPVGLQRLGLPCLLTGSGMAFPWSVIRTVSLANSKTVDDMQLGLDLAIAGYPPIYCQETQVIGRLMEKKAAKSQRSRWEHGHIETLLQQVPRLIKASVKQRRFDLFAIALDLCIPPISLLIIIWALATLGSFLAGTISEIWILEILFAMEGVILAISIFGAWIKFGRDDVSMLTFLVIPIYILSKITLYFAFLLKPQTKWISTERDVIN